MQFEISAEFLDFLIVFARAEDADRFLGAIVGATCPMTAQTIVDAASIHNGNVQLVSTNDHGESCAPTERAPNLPKGVSVLGPQVVLVDGRP